ncbi:MAG: hypothetical protein IID39_08595 [Planctomycetes bacterium]|nr:hypothetical protein [Planctomycetota bacterium]
MDPSVDTTCAVIVDADTGESSPTGCVFDNSGNLQFVEMEVPGAPFWEDKNVRIEFEFIANQIGNNNPGWFVDNVELRNSSLEPGDFDGDGDVDLDDFERFLTCVTGPDGGVLPDCDPGDFDTDNDVDFTDFAAFQRAFTGPG